MATKSIHCILVLILLAGGAQINMPAQNREHSDSTVLGKYRWSFRTNALEWLLTIPNFGVEYDLSGSVFNRMTIGLNARYNWNTAHNYAPPMVFNVFEVRPEFRYYWRTDDKLAVGNWVREKLLKDDARHTWRAYYIGAYINAGTYSFKLGKEGRQGQMYGLGVSMGYSLPLYQYRKGAVDIEFGAALGLAMTQYKAFGHNPNGNYYYEMAGRSRCFHVVPYPVVSELKVAFVYRLRSIEDKYQREDQRRIIEMQRLELQRNDEDALKQARRDSLETVKKERRDSIGTARQARLDSLKAARSMKRDSLSTADEDKPMTSQAGKGGQKEAAPDAAVSAAGQKTAGSAVGDEKGKRIKSRPDSSRKTRVKSGKDKDIIREDEE